MIWKVVLHPLVLKDDLSALDKPIRREILGAIRKKLMVAPEKYGRPLRRELFGLWKLRVGDYRVLYRMKKQVVTVLILKIGMRRDSQVYSEMIRRFKKRL